MAREDLVKALTNHSKEEDDKGEEEEVSSIHEWFTTC